MTLAPTDQHFTEQEAKALKRKSVQAKASTPSAVPIGTFGAITMVDNYGVCSDNAGPFVWEVGIKWDTDDDDEEPIYDWFTHKDAFNACIELVSNERRKFGNKFTEEEATALIGTRVRAKTSWKNDILKEGAVGTITAVSKYTYTNERFQWEVVITWDTNKQYLPNFNRQMFTKYLEII